MRQEVLKAVYSYHEAYKNSKTTRDDVSETKVIIEMAATLLAAEQ